MEGVVWKALGIVGADAGRTVFARYGLRAFRDDAPDHHETMLRGAARELLQRALQDHPEVSPYAAPRTLQSGHFGHPVTIWLDLLPEWYSFVEGTYSTN